MRIAYILYGVTTPTRAHNLQTVHTVNSLVDRGVDVWFIAPELGLPSPREGGVPPADGPADPFSAANLPRSRTRLIRAGRLFDRHRRITPRGRFWSLFLDRSLFAIRAAWHLMRDRVTIVVTRDVIACYWLKVLSPVLRIPVVYELHTLERVMFDAEDRPPSGGDPIDASIRRAVESAAAADFAGHQDDDSAAGRAYKRTLAAIESRAIGGADVVLTITRAAEERLRRDGRAGAIHVVPSGHPPDGRGGVERDPGLRPGLGLPRGRKVLIHAGLSLNGKGIDLIFSMARHLAGDCVVLILGGEPFQVGALEELRDSLGLGSRLMLRPRVAQPDVARYLAACDAGLLLYPRTSYLAEFSSPLKLFEYLGSGLPVIATGLPALREVITDDENGMLVPDDDPAAIAAAIDALMRDDRRLRRLGEAALRTAGAYTFAERARRIEEVLLSQGIGRGGSCT
ncbi:putative glycosyl transferase [Aquisphaera giovannonii]|uniref:Putative glycosyl transferase n=1 Tax=Aquisphaera giovannonii TaxID=406548 RepID=A0A5B9VX17_9BACT|nr:glycosyltransferase [Aquisphaera giovannonii]QEH32411.1 putative glycosyl transferase [Aquisphaera giovannonii]